MTKLVRATQTEEQEANSHSNRQHWLLISSDRGKSKQLQKVTVQIYLRIVHRLRQAVLARAADIYVPLRQ